MKPTLQLRLGQQLAMTPQLQQAIRLLQLSTLELQQEIQQAIDANPLLEQEDDADIATPEIPDDDDFTPPDSSEEMAQAQENMPEELPMDTTWDEVYSASGSSSSGSGLMNSDDEPVYQGETTETLQDYLLWQMRLTPFSDQDEAIALTIIDSIDESGYLITSLDEILLAVNNADESVEMDEVEAVLKLIQHFDPICVAARTIQECLLIQLNQFSADTP